MISLRPFRGQAFHEDLFARHYDTLMRQALRWTNRDWSQAEDLLHDVYLQFVELQTEIQAPELVLGYLCRMLRNLSISRIRRANGLPMEELSLVDYDTAHSGLAQADRRALLRARYVLQRTCIYACERKSSSKSASMLILRFFHGYYPSEIVAISKRSRSSVDNFLTLARREAKLAIERPGVLKAVHGSFTQPLETQQTLSEDMLHDLCEYIFQHGKGECFTAGEVDRRYSSSDPNPLNANELSHLVSCRACLDRVNKKLGLAPLSDRYPPDTTGRDSSSRKGPISVKKTEAERFMDKARRSCQGTREHRPNQIQIAVNGHIKASHSVTSAISTLDLRVEQGRSTSFIQVLSEQNVCLLYLPVNAKNESADFDQQACIDLSDDRRLVLALTTELQGLRVSVVYTDPTIEAVQHREPESLRSVEPCSIPRRATHRDLEASTSLRGLRRLLHTFHQNARAVLADLFPLIRIPMSTTLAAAIVLALASIACLILWVQEPPRISTDTLLAKAEAWDVRQGGDARPGIIYQKVRVTTPSRSFNVPLYRDARGLRRRRHKAGEADGSADGLKELRLIGVDPNAPLSAANYRDWHDRQRARVDRVSKDGRALLKLTTNVVNGPIAVASLTVRANDFHPVERTIKLRGQAGSIEIAELDYQVLPWDSKTEDLFEPENSDASQRRLTPHRTFPIPHLVAEIGEAKLDEAELSARLMLNRMHADNGERINLVRTAAGVQISGIVETEERKHELESQLRLLPNVHPSLLTYQEMERRLAPSSSSTVTFASVTSQPTPLQAYLEDHNWSQERIGQFSFELSRNAELISRECKAIDELIGQFASGKVLSPKADADLSELLSQHRKSLLELVRQEEDALSTTRDHPGAEQIPSSSASTLNALATRNIDLSRKLTSASVDSTSGSAASGKPGLVAADTLAELAATVNSLHVAVVTFNVAEIANGALVPAPNARKSSRNE